ncbi:MAG TPA: RluA family pseudouridine synthase [Candidatus Saccharimonadales bacterium]|nr:RluA family pseudouridine synthase [Candidatus Saccharimonadales bacterium]
MSNLDISRAQRLDHYVVDVLPQLSRSAATKLIADGKVTVNGQPATKAGYKLRRGYKIDIDFNNDDYVAIPSIDVPVLYEDDDCLVLNKPVGLLTHSKGAFNPEATVASFVRSKLTAQSGERAGIVHRLDRATSGVIICAKTPTAMTWLQRQFSLRKAKKTYIAIVTGHLKEPHAVIDMPIERNPKRPQTFRVGVNGKSAITEYKVLKADDTLSMVELQPQTGRTHQLRVHLSHLGHPILGDELYGGKPAERLFLHALRLELTLPNRERKIFEAPLPSEFNATIDT